VTYLKRDVSLSRDAVRVTNTFVTVIHAFAQVHHEFMESIERGTSERSVAAEHNQSFPLHTPHPLTRDDVSHRSTRTFPRGVSLDCARVCVCVA
jgi:hypothetical protein